MRTKFKIGQFVQPRHYETRHGRIIEVDDRGHTYGGIYCKIEEIDGGDRNYWHSSDLILIPENEARVIEVLEC